MTIEDRPYRVGEAAAAVHVSVPTIYRWIEMGILPCSRVSGRRIYIQGADLERGFRSEIKAPKFSEILIQSRKRRNHV